MRLSTKCYWILTSACIVCIGASSCGRPESTPVPAIGGSPIQAPSVPPIQPSEDVAEKEIEERAPAQLFEQSSKSSSEQAVETLPTQPPRSSAAKSRGGASPKKAKARRRTIANPRIADSSDDLRGPEIKQIPLPLEVLQRRLGKAHSRAAVDCESATERQQSICDLSEQICQMIDRDPNVASLASYCTQARERCRQAKLRTADQCED